MRQFEGFLTHQECSGIISVVDRAAAALGVKNYLTALPLIIEEARLTDRLLSLRREISELVGLPVANQEPILATVYPEGAGYPDHLDSFRVEEGSVHTREMYECNMSHGGHRAHTALVYLNEDFSGGETEFPSLGLSVKPKVGMLVVWSNVKDGEADASMVHAARCVARGRKYVLVVYVREKEYTA